MSTVINVAVLGCGMMGQEHISYMKGYSQIHIKFLCDPNLNSIQKAMSLITSDCKPQLLKEEKELLEKAQEIDLLVIATPNYLHTPQLLRWAHHPISILVEKPVAISGKQVRALRNARNCFRANIWVAMEYRYIPAIQKLYQLLPRIGQIKNITIRENRFPFLSKVDEWNKDIEKSGDTLVEKCCHFFDLFRLISGQEVKNCTSKVNRGLLNSDYGYDVRTDNPYPIIDSAYVLLDFTNDTTRDSALFNKKTNNGYPPIQNGTIGCLELCMYADGSRHQEEIIVTGMNGRVEAYLPENKVFYYQRPDKNDWVDRTQPPPRSSIKEEIIDCSDLKKVYSFANEIPQHSGHHYSSTAVEWKYLIDAIELWKSGGDFVPQVSLNDGLLAVELGMRAQKNINPSSEDKKDNENTLPRPNSFAAFSTKSSEHLLNLAIAQVTIQPTTSLRIHPSNNNDFAAKFEEKREYE